MRFILDGDPNYSEPARPLDDMFTEIERAETFLNPLDRAHKKLVKRMARRYAKALSTFCALVNDRLKNVGHLIQPQLQDSDKVNARTFLPHRGENGFNVWPILISLGWFPQVIGLANRLVVADRFAGEGDYLVNRVFEDWNPISRPLGVLTVCFDDKDGIEQATEQITLDTMLLVFLHELAHALQGHLFYECKSNDEERAIEAEADYEAGRYFCMGLTRFVEALETPRPQSLDDSFRRLSRAVFLFSTLLHAVSGNSGRYHLPFARLKCFLGGAAEASGFRASEEILRAYEKETYFMYLGFVQASTTSKLEGGLDSFIDNWPDAQNNSDDELLTDVTWPIVQRWKASRRYMLKFHI